MPEIKKLTDKEHILLRPTIYIGNISYDTHLIHVYDKDKNTFYKKEVYYNNALVKIFREILDNSIDEAIRNKFKHGNKINIILTEKHFEIEDNGKGIPNKKKNGEYLAKIALGYARAGSNFDEDRESIGINGLGAYLTNVFSKRFEIVNKDKNKVYYAKWNNNSDFVEEKVESNKTKETGLKTTVYPDFERFGTDKFTDNDLLVIETQLMMIILSYPKLSITLNGQILSYSNDWRF